MKRIILIIAALVLMGCSEDNPLVLEVPPGPCDDCYLCVKGFERTPQTRNRDLLSVKVCPGGEVEFRTGRKCYENWGEVITPRLIEDGTFTFYEAEVPSNKTVTVTVSTDGQFRSWSCIDTISE